jgi:acyl-coenzyme A thioesterase PaaI-like protein
VVTAVPKDAVPRHDGAVQATSGEFAGWWTWTRDNYEVTNGPFWHREENGTIRCAFRLEKKHMNGGGAVHGGCLMTFADYCLFALGNKVLEAGRGVTLSFSSEFIDAAYEGELIEGLGEVVRAVHRLHARHADQRRPPDPELFRHREADQRTQEADLARQATLIRRQHAA